jgi:hypothetical protein
VCHQTYEGDKERTNMMRDGFQQGSSAFSEQGETNGWKNLFADRRKAIEKMSDEEILRYVSEDNYSQLVSFMRGKEYQGEVLAIKDLANASEAFDDEGIAKDGSRWVAFSYKPFPSTFWPTNGSTDDTMIRLPEAFSSRAGQYSRDVYFANLSLVEMAIADLKEITTPSLNEQSVGLDLDGDGKLSGEVRRMKRRDHYLGDAAHVAAMHMLYPEGTEFLHTVRYIGVSDSGDISPARRMKEVRYMRKAAFHSKSSLVSRYYAEFKEKHFGKLPQAQRKGDQGTSNSFGWLLLGFIEDASGRLRRQHQEEEFACVGCHKSIGSTIDQTFGFPRKVAGRAGWGYLDLRKISDVPSLGEVEGEYLTYMKRVGGGDEFRQNQEMLTRFFSEDGSVDEARVQSAKNIYEIITPSRERALLLNKAYRLVVKEQSFLFGRDTAVAPARNVFERVDTDAEPLLKEHRYKYDIRLAWNLAPSGVQLMPRTNPTSL